MPRIGLLVESLYVAGRLLYLGTAHPEAWPALRLRFEAEAIDYFAVDLRPEDAEAGFIVFASTPFACRPAPALAKLYNLRGQSARQHPAHEGAVFLLAAAHVPEATRSILVSDGWNKLISE